MNIVGGCPSCWSCPDMKKENINNVFFQPIIKYQQHQGHSIGVKNFWNLIKCVRTKKYNFDVSAHKCTYLTTNKCAELIGISKCSHLPTDTHMYIHHSALAFFS